MKKLLNTLYITTQSSYLYRDGETVVVSVDKVIKIRLPIHTLEGIVCFGQVSCSPPLMHLCGENKVKISFLSDYGKFLARVEGPTSGNVNLRREQYRKTDQPIVCSEIAKSFVLAKIVNSRAVLQRALRDHQDITGKNDIEMTIKTLQRSVDEIKKESDLNVIRGLEGDAAKNYFHVFDHLITTQKDYFYFKERSRRPPLDNMNALLSFLYTIVTHDVVGALESVGLDPAVGFLHRDRPGRPSLALDLVEELRSVIADRLALTLINRQQINGKGFNASESGAVIMNDETRKEVLLAYQKKKKDEITHPFLNEKIAIGLIPYVQAMLFARFLRGDLETYPPFFWK